MGRSLLERVKDIFNIIDKSDKPFPKSKFREIGLSAKASEDWLDLIVFIQNQTKIRVIKTDYSVIVEKIQDS